LFGSAPEVEAPDQLAADGLHVFLGVERAVATLVAEIQYVDAVPLVAGEPIFGLPGEVRREEVEAILVAGGEEVAGVGVGGDRGRAAAGTGVR
jgi:hypothetical protein